MHLTHELLCYLELDIHHSKKVEEIFLIFTCTTETHSGDLVVCESKGRRFIGWYYPDFGDYVWFVTLKHLLFTNEFKILGKLTRADPLPCPRNRNVPNKD